MVYEVGTIAHSCGVKNPRELRRFHALVVQPNGITAALDELYPEVSAPRPGSDLDRSSAGSRLSSQHGAT
jgi:hypothetical protein